MIPGALAPLIGAMPGVGLVGIGGALGAVCRHAVGLRIESRWSVVVVNVFGSLLFGVALAAPIDPELVRFVAVGFCGAFTTFSSFAVETIATAENGDSGTATAFAIANLAGAVAAVLVGLSIGGTL